MLHWHDFEKALTELGVTPTRAVFDELVSAYSQPQRHYHGSKHIADCLALFDRFKELAEHPAEVAVAIWFHDAVYDSHRQDNEQLSAEWAGLFLCDTGAAQESIDRIQAMILATKTHHADNGDQRLLLDIDLSILGAEPKVFEQYDEQIRREYAWIEESTYRSGRSAVLQGFLDRPQIYHAAPLQIELESQARENLTRKLKELS